MHNLKHMQIEKQKFGYLNEKNAISMQEFITICNLIRDWNQRIPADMVKINVIERVPVNIKMYLQDTSKPLEELLTNLENQELYYLTFQSKDIVYNNTGRISEITMVIRRKTQ